MINFFKNFFNKNNFEFNNKSKDLILKAHPDLQKLVNKALSLCEIQFQVYYSARTIEEQIKLVKDGKSKTYNSRHLHNMAVDVYAEIEKGKANWEHKHYVTIDKAFQEAAEKLKISYIWGGTFKGFVDANHFELNKYYYPDNPDIIKELKNKKLI